MITEQTISDVMGELGRRGTGKTKRRGGKRYKKYYKDLSAKRWKTHKKQADKTQ